MTRAAGMRFSVDAWDPGYGTSVDEDFAESTASLDTSVEVAAADWRPIHASALAVAEAPESALFVDGVRRIDARAWIDSPLPDGTLGADASPALCASYAAGVLCCCEGRSHLLSSLVRHRLVTTSPDATDIVTTAGTFSVLATPADPRQSEMQLLSNALQRGLGELETIVAVSARAGLADHGLCADTDLLVVDGPLYQRTHLDRALGFIKTHRTATYRPSCTPSSAPSRPATAARCS